MKTKPSSTLFSRLFAFRVASLAPALLALRDAFGRLPGQRPLARVQLSAFSSSLPSAREVRSYFTGLLAFRATRRNPVGPFARAVAITVVALMSFGNNAWAATWQWDGGAGTGNWQTATNWNPDTGNPNFNGTFADRLNVNGAQALIYTSAEGTTNYGATGLAGVVIGSGTAGSGTMTITGGTFSTLNSNAVDVIGNQNSNTGILNIQGGTFIGATAGTSLGLGGGTGRVSTLNVDSGSATVKTLTLNSANATVNLNGGTFSVNNIANTSTAGINSTFNFNGGTLKAMQNTAGFLNTVSVGTARANVRNGGAIIDTNSFSVTIALALSHSNVGGDAAIDGGLTKNGSGTLTLTGANTYTGVTTINTGSLKFGKQTSLYNNVTANWTASNLVVNSGATASFFVGGTGEFTASDLDLLKALGTASGGFKSGSTLALDTSNTASFSYSSDIADPNGGSNVLNLNKLGSTILALSGSNTYTGSMTVSAGTFQAGSVNALGAAGSFASRTVLANGATLELATDSSIAAEWLDCGSNVTGNVVLNRATAGDGFTQSLGTQYLGTAAVLNVSKGANVTGGTATLGLSSLIMSGGAVGIATFNPTTAAVSITGAVNSGVAFAKTLVLDGTNTANAISGDISNGSGTVSVTKSNSGTWTLSGTNSYTGATLISGGVLSLTNNNALNGTSGVEASGSTSAVLELGNGVTITGKSITISGYGTGVRGSLRAAVGATAEWAGGVVLGGTGSPADTRVGAMANGTLKISGTISDGTRSNFLVSADATGGKVIVSGANSYTGETQVYRGTLALGANNSLPTGSVLNVHAGSSVSDPAVFDLNGYNQQVAGLYRGFANGGVTGTATVTNSGGSVKILTITNTSDYTYDSAITGNLELVKAGAGIQALTGANTYTGATTVSAGTLAANAANALQNTTTVTVTGGSLLIGASEAINDGAEVVLTGTGSSIVMGGSGSALTENVGALTLNANSTLDFGTNAGGNTLWFSGGSYAADKILTISNWDFDLDHLYFTASQSTNLGAFKFGLLDATQRTISENQFEIIAVPEPGTILAGVILLGGLFFFERKRVWKKLKGKS